MIGRKQIVWTTGILLLVLGLGIGGYIYVSRDTNPIPTGMRDQLTFSPFILRAGVKNFTTTDYKFSTAEENTQILTFLIHANDGLTVTVSEYAQPPQFAEIPEYKDRFLTNVAKQYDTVQTANGTIYLGRMTKRGDRQLAVMLERGLIVFMNPDKELDKAQWRNLGDQLEIRKVTD